MDNMAIMVYTLVRMDIIKEGWDNYFKWKDADDGVSISLACLHLKYFFERGTFKNVSSYLKRNIC